MASYTIAEIGAVRERLELLLGQQGAMLRLGHEDRLDACGAQLILCAVQTARARGESLSLDLPEGSEALALWRALALDRVCDPGHTAEGGAPA